MNISGSVSLVQHQVLQAREPGQAPHHVACWQFMASDVCVRCQAQMSTTLEMAKDS